MAIELGSKTPLPPRLERIANLYRIYQLYQNMGKEMMQVEEFNSIIEREPKIMGSVANHLGVTLGKLKVLIIEGKVPSRGSVGYCIFDSLMRELSEILEVSDGRT